MGVETRETYTCDNPRKCSNTATNSGEVTAFTISYRTRDGSSGVEEKHFCATHDEKVISTLRDAGLLPNAPETVGAAKKTAAKKTAKKMTTRSR